MFVSSIERDILNIYFYQCTFSYKVRVPRIPPKNVGTLFSLVSPLQRDPGCSVNSKHSSRKLQLDLTICRADKCHYWKHQSTWVLTELTALRLGGRSAP